MKKNINKKGFTLIETVLVVAIITIVTGVTIVSIGDSYSRYQTAAEQARNREFPDVMLLTKERVLHASNNTRIQMALEGSAAGGYAHGEGGSGDADVIGGGSGSETEASSETAAPSETTAPTATTAPSATSATTTTTTTTTATETTAPSSTTAAATDPTQPATPAGNTSSGGTPVNPTSHRQQSWTDNVNDYVKIPPTAANTITYTYTFDGNCSRVEGQCSSYSVNGNTVTVYVTRNGGNDWMFAGTQELYFHMSGSGLTNVQLQSVTVG